MLQDSLNVQMCLLYVFLPIKGTIKSKERDPKQAKFNKKKAIFNHIYIKSC